MSLWTARDESPEYWERDDDSSMTIEQATEDATEMTEADPYGIAWWLNNDAAIPADGPVDVPAASRRFQAGEDLTDGELLALIFRAGDDCRFAAQELNNRRMAHKATLERIAELAGELMPEEEIEE